MTKNGVCRQNLLASVWDCQVNFTKFPCSVGRVVNWSQSQSRTPNSLEVVVPLLPWHGKGPNGLHHQPKVVDPNPDTKRLSGSLGPRRPRGFVLLQMHSHIPKQLHSKFEAPGIIQKARGQAYVELRIKL